jgi:hypothetical protein
MHMAVEKIEKNYQYPSPRKKLALMPRGGPGWALLELPDA